MNGDSPALVDSQMGYNFVRYRGRYFVLPMSQGNVNLESTEAGDYLSALTLDAAERLAFSEWVEENQPVEPSLFKQLWDWNLVYCDGSYYAIPLEAGEVCLMEPAARKGLLYSDTLEELWQELVEQVRTEMSNQTPVLITSLQGFNVVCYQEKFIGLPEQIGNVRLEKTGLDGIRGKIVKKSLQDCLDAISKTKRVGPFWSWINK